MNVFRAMRSRKAGFTLLEAMIASFGVALGFVGLLVSFSTLSRTATMASQESVAMHQARQQIETLRLLSFADTALSNGTHMIPNGQYVVTNFTYSTTRKVTLILNVVAQNHTTSQVSVATVLTSLLHK